MAKPGQPTKYNKKTAEYICAQLTIPRTLLSICKDEGMPDRRTVYNWLLNNDEFFHMYTRAKEMQADAWVDEIIEIADDASYDYTEREGKNGEYYAAVDHEHIHRSRLRVDTRKWFAAKVLPKRYGDKQLEQNNSEDNGTLKQLMDVLKKDGEA